jgi:uncharacterized RDD family membrane protein YckC
MNVSNSYLSIDTPENVAFGYEVAGIGGRFLAAIIDTLLIIILQAIVNLTVLFIAASLLGNDWATEGLFVWVAAMFGLISFLLFWGFYIIFEMIWNGQSPGKRWVGLRVLKTDGTPITLTESVVRNLVRLIDFLPAYYGLGVVTMFINDQSRRLGDLAAGTLVVYDSGTVTLAELRREEMMPGLQFREISPATEQLPLERLTSEEMQLVEDYLRRRYELANRYEVAAKLVQRLHEQMALPDPQLTGTAAEDLLAEIYKLRKLRAEERN